MFRLKIKIKDYRKHRTFIEIRIDVEEINNYKNENQSVHLEEKCFIDLRVKKKNEKKKFVAAALS